MGPVTYVWVECLAGLSLVSIFFCIWHRPLRFVCFFLKSVYIFRSSNEPSADHAVCRGCTTVVDRASGMLVVLFFFNKIDRPIFTYFVCCVCFLCVLAWIAVGIASCRRTASSVVVGRRCD